jgi:hypothetical protein
MLLAAGISVKCSAIQVIVLNNGKWRNISNNRDIKIYDCLIEEACKYEIYRN